MAVQVLQLFAPVELAAAAATIFTVPSLPSTTVLARGRVRFTNTDTASHAVTAYAIQSGGSAVVADCFMNAESIAPNTHLDIDLPVLAAGGFMQAFADTANKVTVLQLDGTLFS
jgi:plastocyanin